MKDLKYLNLLHSYSNTVCGLAHGLVYNHNSAKHYPTWPAMRHWHEGKRDACRSALQAIVNRLEGDDKKFVLDEVRRTVTYCKQSLASAAMASAK